MKREYIVPIDYIGETPPGNEELVRCKNCKHWTKEEDVCLELGWCRVHERRFVEEWFCADGEKK